jgi:hypothetical protein
MRKTGMSSILYLPALSKLPQVFSIQHPRTAEKVLNIGYASKFLKSQIDLGSINRLFREATKAGNPS